MKEVEKKIKKANVDDYNQVLKVYPEIQDNTRSTIKSDLDYIIEKSALPVNKHKNSKWVDDSYNLIGKSRLYKKEYKLAIETFKYVNTKSTDDNARHAAMILLMRTFLDSLNFDNARSVHEFLQKENITDINSAEYFLTKASLYRSEEDYENTRLNLEQAIPFIKSKEDKARVHFIVGQIHQLQGNDKEAYKSYNTVFKNNPPYELFFYSRLYLAQVSNLAENSDRKKIDKYFRKLLKDQKNLEYKDKIYYEIAKYEFKQGNYNKAITNFESSLRENKGNPYQKARSYLALGELYYDKMHNYGLSKLYYDSTASTWDTKDKAYKPIKERQKNLTEFVHYLDIVNREDSLQRLCKMSTAELDRFLDKIIDEKAKKEQELAAKKAKQEEALKNQQASADNFQQAPLPGMIQGNQEWYFYNASSLTLGKADFIKKWGKRKLEDNWRRSKKLSEIEFEEDTAKSEPVVEISNEQKREDSIQARKAEKKLMLQDVELTRLSLDSSNLKIEDAMYNLAKIYNLKLNEVDNAVVTFEKILSRFPQSELKPEIYYFLYLIQKNRNNQAHLAYKDKLLREFPTSQYARIIINPNYLVESKIANQQAAELYKSAFELHKTGSYITSDSLIAQIRVQYPENNIPDKLEFLGILNKGKTQSASLYRNLMEKFTVDYPASNLVAKAKEIIVQTDEYILEQSGKGVLVNSEVKFIKNFDKPHVFVCLLKKEQAKGDALKQELSKYNLSKGFKLTLPESYSFSDSTVAVFIKGFNDKQSAKDYMDKVYAKENILKKYKTETMSPFIITSDNLKILEQSGNTAAYLKFFRMNYNETLLYGE